MVGGIGLTGLDHKSALPRGRGRVMGAESKAAPFGCGSGSTGTAARARKRRERRKRRRARRGMQRRKGDGLSREKEVRSAAPYANDRAGLRSPPPPRSRAPCPPPLPLGVYENAACEGAPIMEKVGASCSPTDRTIRSASTARRRALSEKGH